MDPLTLIVLAAVGGAFWYSLQGAPVGPAAASSPPSPTSTQLKQDQVAALAAAISTAPAFGSTAAASTAVATVVAPVTDTYKDAVTSGAAAGAAKGAAFGPLGAAVGGVAGGFVAAYQASGGFKTGFTGTEDPAVRQLAQQVGLDPNVFFATMLGAQPLTWATLTPAQKQLYLTAAHSATNENMKVFTGVRTFLNSVIQGHLTDAAMSHVPMLTAINDFAPDTQAWARGPGKNTVWAIYSSALKLAPPLPVKTVTVIHYAKPTGPRPPGAT